MHTPSKFPTPLSALRRPALVLLCSLLASASANAGIVLSGGGLTLVEEGGSIAPGNLAATGTAFAKDVLQPPNPLHTIPNLNDQLFGNGESWIGNSANSFAGISFGANPIRVSSIAFGRDNTANGFTDRTLGTYTLQFTKVANPSASTPEADWTTIGTLEYQSAGGAKFDLPWKRHRYTFDEVSATGIRLVAQSSGICIDELELYFVRVVNTVADQFNTPSGPTLSLREAMRDAAADAGADTIFFAQALSGQTITLGSEIAVAGTGGITVDATNLPGGIRLVPAASGHRAFSLASGRSLDLRGLTLAGFSVAPQTGGAITSQGSLALSRCTFSGNSAVSGGAINTGTGSLTAERCTFSGNVATSLGGAISWLSGPLTMKHCTLAGNTAATGGAIGIASDSLSITNCIIAGNTASTGPDISNSGTYTSSGVNLIGNLANSGLIDDATIFTGTALLAPLGNYGGPTQTMALLPGSPARNAAALLSPAITTDQRGFPIVGTPDIGAYEAQIGAISSPTINEDTSSGALAFTVGTVGTLSAASGNLAVIANFGIQLGGGGPNRTVTVTPLTNAFGTATITITDSLSGETQQFTVTVNPVNDAPTFIKGADQVVPQNSGARTVVGWATGFNPGSVYELGQSVLTYLVSNTNNALFSVQPAVAMNGTLTFTPAANASGIATVTVQVRDSGGTANGGVDTSTAQTFTITVNPEVTTTADTGAGSLRAALASAATIPGPNTIPFAPGLSGQTITLASEIVVNDSDGVTLDAASLPAGITISGGNATRLFSVAPFRSLTITGATFAGGNAVGAVASGSGGAIFNDGTLVLTKCTLSSNGANEGGAIFNNNTLVLTQCTLFGNSATGQGGGAIFNNENKNSVLTQCTLSANFAIFGGAILNTGALTLTNNIFAGNTAELGPDIVILFTGIIARTGVNFIGNTTDSGLSASATLLTTAQNGPILLAPLGHYGGPTQTMALLPGSPARNAAAVLSPAITSDQRGFPIVGTPDLGAYEAGTLGTNYNAFIYETLPATASAPQHATTFDFDGDGQSNEDEWLALTDPAMGTSRFRVTQTAIGGGNFSVTFPTALGRSYQLQSSPDLATPWANVGSAIPGTGGDVTLPASVSGQPRNFFRVTVARQ